MLTRGGLRQRLGKRGYAIGVALLAAALVVGGATAYAAYTSAAPRSLCAQLPDGAGLYPGNAVNIRGVRVGEVTELVPSPGQVTVHMQIAERPLNADLRVVAINNSVLADRRLELVDAQSRGGPTLSADACVPRSRTYTPISVSTAFQSFTTLFDDIGGVGPDAQLPIRDLLDEAAGQFSGTGPELNQTIKNLAGLMSDPNDFLAQLRTVFDDLAILSEVAGDNWPAIRDIGVDAADLTHFMGALFESFVYIFDGLGEAGPGLDDLLADVVPPILDASDDMQPVIDVGLARLDDLTAILKELPGIAVALRTSVSRQRGGFTMTVRAPQVATATPSSAALCAQMNAVDPGSCARRGEQTAAIDLGALVTRMVQGGVH